MSLHQTLHSSSLLSSCFLSSALISCLIVSFCPARLLQGGRERAGPVLLDAAAPRRLRWRGGAHRAAAGGRGQRGRPGPQRGHAPNEGHRELQSLVCGRPDQGRGQRPRREQER